MEEAATAVHRRLTPRFLIGGSNMSLDSALTATADSKLPDPTRAGFAENFIGWMAATRLRMTSRSGRPARMLDGASHSRSTCWLIQRGSQWLLWDTGVPESALNDPKGWSTLPKLIVYHLDRTLTDQLARSVLRQPTLLMSRCLTLTATTLAMFACSRIQRF